MMSALLETIGALGVLASIAAKISFIGWGRWGKRGAAAYRPHRAPRATNPEPCERALHERVSARGDDGCRENVRERA